MRVVGVTEFGGPEALRVLELPEPHAGPGEVRIQVKAAAVNPTDTVLRAGWRAEQQAGLEPPYVPGTEAAGVLDEIGPDTVTDLQLGDDVMGIIAPRGHHGAYSEFVVLPAESVTRVPTGASYAEASTLPMNGLTARMALDKLGLTRGQTLAVTGSAGALGGYVIQLAKAEGLRVIADAADKDRALVESLGADVIVPRGDDFAVHVRGIEPDGVPAVVDAALLNDKVEPAVRDGGGIATVRGFSAETERDLQYHQVWVLQYAKEHAKLDELRSQAEDGTLTLRVADTVPAEQAAEAHRRLEAGGVRGRLVITF